MQSLTVIPYKIKIKNRWCISNLWWHRMYITIPKWEKGRIVRRSWVKARPKTGCANSKLCISILMWKHSSYFQLLSALLTTTYFSLLGWFHSLLAALLSRYPMALASPASWGLQGNPGFTFTASHNGLFRPPFRDTPDTCLTSAAFLRHSLTLKPEPCDWGLLLAGAGTRMAPFLSYIFASSLFSMVFFTG